MNNKDFESLDLEFRRMSIPKEILPINCYKEWNRKFAQLQPIAVWGDTENINFESSRQLNWTNTFLWKKLGSINPILDQILEIPAITNNNKNQLKELAENCSEEYHNIKLEIAKIENTQDLEKVKTQIRKYQANLFVMSIECRILYAYTTNHEIKRRNTERLKIPRNFQSCVSIKNIPNDEVSIPQQVVIEFNKNKQKKKLEPNRLSFTKDKLILGNAEISRRNELEISEYLKRQECSTSINYFSPTKILISVVNEPRINFLPCVISTSIERSYVKNEFIQHNQPFNIDPPRTYRNGDIEYVITQEVELALSFIDETKRELMKIHTFELVNNSEQNILLGRDFLSKIDYSLSSQYLIIDGYRIPTIN